MSLIVLVNMPTSEAQQEPYIDEVMYSKNSAESLTIVQSGRDNATYYKYLILDDYSEAPENWFEANFNDSEWVLSAAPFGDRSSGGVDPNTDWDTSGNSPYNNDIILIRHKFQVSGIVTSAEIDIAVANFCTPYLNGNMIHEERGGDSRAQEYWNDDVGGTILPSSFTQGENVLAVYARDYVGGWGSSNRQWIDLQITASVFEPTNESIIFGDTVTVAVKGGNNGDESANEVIIKSYTNETNISTLSFTSIPQNHEDLIFFSWTPEYIGENSLNINVSCNCTDTNLSNNDLVLNITAKIYRLKAEINNELEYINQTRLLSKIITITNNGDLMDNVTLIPSSGEINSQITFIPNDFILQPGESIDVTINAILPQSIEDGRHNLSFTVKTQHDYSINQNLLNSGKDSDVTWKWIQSSDYEELYGNTNWTTASFNDTNWSNAYSPFGDSSIDGVNYKTEWNADNYAYFRHVFNITNIGIYENGIMKINVASNNFGDHYINGIFVFGDLDEGDGHGAEYWNEEVQVFTNYLSQGENVIASVVGNPQNTQWFDQEIIVTFPQANLWNYKDITYEIPIMVDTTAPITKVNENGFYKNSTIIPLTWKEISSEGDLEGFYLYYQIKNGSSITDWTLYDYYNSTYGTNFTTQNGMIYRFRTIGVDIYGNKESKGVYDTEIIIDMDLPKSELWLSEGNIQYTNLDGVTINWKNNETIDIQGYYIEYRKENNESWNNYGLFTNIGEYWFEPETDGTYFIRSISIDYAGNKELKETPDITITFDRINPEVKLNQIDLLRGTDDLILSINTKTENLSTLEIEYARLIENNEDILEWKTFDENWIDEDFTIRNLVDGYTYYFRINPTDYAGNDYPREEYEYIFNYKNDTNEILLPVVPLKPVMTGKIKNIEITVDENLNGIYDKILQEYNGKDLSGMKANQYWIDYELGKIFFGNGDIGYLPPTNSSISVVYSGYDLITTIDNNPPMPIETIEYKIEEENNLTIEWNEPEGAVTYIVESRNNFSRPWEIIENINYTQNKMKYQITNLSGGFHYYRIVSVDRMGYQNSDMEGEMLEIFIEYENVNSASNGD
ncbi:MAG: fibronectin type III domain-containing protein, partial [Candidatus Thermoplasmatota archaeon]|nr:fibronectin type III domain-containing protein [Candidatus Thermoplasmatota archaeon]